MTRLVTGQRRFHASPRQAVGKLFVFSWSEIEILVHFFLNRINYVYLWVFVPDIDDSLD